MTGVSQLVLRTRSRFVLVAMVSIATVLVGAARAAAAPTPAGGPTGGGTTVADQAGVVLTRIAAGGTTGYGLGRDGVLYAWGSNYQGELGDGTTTSRLTPVPVSLPAGVTATQIAAGDREGYALGSDGLLYAWGWNYYGQLGDGTTTNRSTPVPVSLPAGATIAQIAIGGYTGYALDSDGVLYAWGWNYYGQLGDGTTINRSAPVPVSVPVGVTFTQIAVNSGSAYALGSDDLLYAWGWNLYGQLGDGTTINRSTPVPVSVPVGVTFTQIAAGNSSVFALGSDDLLYAWGWNLYGQLGDGTTMNRSTPVPVSLPAGVTATQIVSGGTAGYAVGSDGLLYAWGLNNRHQLGDGTATDRLTPVPVPLPEGVTVAQIDASGGSGYALASDGLLYAWGYNIAGQLGDGTTLDRWAPVLTNSVTVTSVVLAGVSGTNLTSASNGTWSVDTPGGCGLVDVVVNWTQFGATHASTFVDGFAYGSPPTITGQPSSATIATGGTFTTTVAVSGDDTPTIQWQQQDSGGAWADVPGATDATLVVAGLAETTSYRAVATNCWGATAAATSAMGTATVKDPAPTHTVRFHPNGGVGAMPTQTASVPTALRANAFTRAGFTFSGWNTAADGSGTGHAPGQVYGFTADMDLYAQWARDSEGTGPVNPPATGSAPAGGPGGPSTGDGGALPSTGAPFLDVCVPGGLALMLFGAALLRAAGRRRREV